MTVLKPTQGTSTGAAPRKHQSYENVDLETNECANESPDGCGRATACALTGVVPQFQRKSLMTRRRRWLNILGLSMGWCLMVSTMFIQLSTTTLAARDYGGSARATLPAGVMMAAATVSMMPGSMAMQRYGRRAVLLLSALAGVGGAVMMVVAARLRLLPLLIAGSVPLGVGFAQANNLRFAATEFAPAGMEAQAMSLVVTGAVLSSVVGPEVGRHTLHALDPPYTATYCFLAGLCLVYIVLVAVVDFGELPVLAAEKAAAAGAASSRADGGGGSRSKAYGPGRPALSATCAGSAEREASAAAPVEGAAASDRLVVYDDQEADLSLQHFPARPVQQRGGLPQAVDSAAGREEQHPGARRWLSGVDDRSSDGARPGNAADRDGLQLSRGEAVERAPTRQDSDAATGCREDTKAAVEMVVDAGVEDSVSSGGSLSGAASGGKLRSGLGSGGGSDSRASLRRMILSWEYVVPVLTAAMSYCGMAGMMTASPLVIRDSSYSFSETTQVIQVHIISMFLPSLFTGHVIGLISARWTMALGALALLGGTAVFYSGKTLPVFFAGNSVVGLGWNWAYVGASALVAATYQPDTKFAAQGLMDTAVLAGTGLSVVLAGSLYSRLGWTSYTGVFVGLSGVIVALDGLLLVLVRGRRRRARGSAEGGAAAAAEAS